MIRKLRVSFAGFLFICALTLSAQEKYSVDWNYSGQSFIDFVLTAESKLPVRFFYRNEWISNLVMNDYQACRNLNCVLGNLFRETTLHYVIDDDGNVIITKDFAIDVGNGAGEDNFISNAGYADSLEQQKKIEVLFLEVGRRSEADRPGNVIVSGYVTDEETREPLPGVSVYIRKLSAGTVTNAHGYYSLSLPRGAHIIQFTFIGMRETRVNLRLNGPGEMNIMMKGILIPLEETVVSAERNVTLQRFETGVEKINIPSFKMLPSFMGEADILKNLLLVTGVQTTGEGSAGFNVRGGSADQNLILLDGTPLYNSSHFFGFFPAVNSDMIKDATLYKGGMPARFGGRISSVLDIVTSDGERKEFSGNAGISPVTAHFKAEGPVIRDTLSYLVAGRATYSNWLLRLPVMLDFGSSNASFYDLNTKLSYSPDRTNKIDFSAYLSHDRFGLDTSAVYAYENILASLRWKHFWNSRFFSLLTLSHSFYTHNIQHNDVPGEEYILTHSINTSTLKGDFNIFRGLHEINFGMELNYHHLLPGSYLPGSDSSIVTEHLMEKETALEGALYIDDRMKITDYLSAEAGLRFSSFHTFGPRTVFLYDPRYSMSLYSLTDTVSYGQGDLLSSYAGPELRASLNLRLSGNNSLKINYNKTRQYLHLLTNSASISPTDSWKLSDNYLKPETGDQYAIGFYQFLFGRKIETSAELYYKDIKNMTDFKGGTVLTMIENIEQDLIYVKGKAYGIELSLKKNDGKLRYNIGYTYARTFARSTGEFRDESINGGKWYPANYDRPHELFLTMHYLYSRRLNFSANYTYSSGRPVTYPISQYRFNDLLLIHYSERNKYRMPYYSRLDISLRVNGNLKIKKIAHPYWTFSVINLFARANPYSVYFVEKNDRIKGYQLSVFGTAIPSVSFNFDF
ncbi:MAG TPA: TonB-dependent receptor [Bacteroidales bacterium]|nr:TonB-dependent receptor [Bacteroidales bacterium]HPF02509.1 TonB-dependent receptor [Bacteroidales bacterium]HPJ59043.1 TonB-dependent receptor [Bacteroidales bacterium]HPR13227.1 TonB-dependent receptor [Bacteroidales bacterium]HRW84733.1 TonB-dependent receptor [Bacteroidales bacterium]